MNSIFKYKLLVRISIIYLFHLVIKGFDYSFGHFLDFTPRGILYGLGFTFIWLLVWYFADWMNNYLIHQKALLKLIINIVIGYGFSVITVILYRSGDVFLFNKKELWEEIPFLNPEFTISLLLVYLIAYGVNEYIQSKLTIKEEQLKSEKLKKENALAQYIALKGQIEPHFLFNSLSVLSSIVHSNADLASDFIVKLSKTLRYLIEKNEATLVLLEEELKMVNDYFFLLKTRFNSSINLHVDIPSSEDYFVPPSSVQMLIENAIKHNKFTADSPLLISITIKDRYLLVNNNLNKKQNEEASISIGLKNIEQRYLLVAEESIIIKETVDSFCVKLPLLNQQHYANFNH